MGASEIAEVAADGVADTMHVTSEEALALEEATRGMGAANLAYFGLGLAAGAAIGGFVAWKIAYRKAETKYNDISDAEIAEMKEHYNKKTTAREAQVGKGDLGDLVRDRGYSSEDTEPPMTVTPPSAVTKRAQEIAEAEDEAAGEPPDDKDEDYEPEVRNIFRDNRPPDDRWDWHKERSQRSPLKPYVIHREERDEQDAYDVVIFTYYEQDDVVCNERDEVLSEDDRERIIGEANLEKFGHGSGDSTVVYVRNDKLEMDMEINRSPNSFAEEVHGFEPEIKHGYHRRRGRTYFDDE